MYYDFLILALLLVVGIAFVYANMIVFSILRPKNPGELKLSTYECGEEAFGSSWIRFDMRFYTVALIFVVFDLEIAFLFPWAAVFKAPFLHGIVLVEGLIFIGILFLGLIYVWAKGDLDWIKAFSKGRAVMTGVHPSDFTEERRALYTPDAPAAADADERSPAEPLEAGVSPSSEAEEGSGTD